MNDRPVLQISKIGKSYGSTVALENVSFSMAAGEVVGLIGENGAGKSTLVRILCGATRPDRGEMRLGDRAVTFQSPAEASAAGIGVVHQHESLIPKFSIAENLAMAAGLPALPSRAGMREQALRLYQKFGLNPGDPSAACESLSVGARQRVEILKALCVPRRILLLDEPTAALAPAEVGEFLGVVESLRSSGVAVILVDHKLHEVQGVCSRIVVLRRGRVVADVPSHAQSPDSLAALMVGHDVEPVRRDAGRRPPGGTVLAISHLSTGSAAHGTALDIEHLEVGRGEIVGIAGVDGNGQPELVEALLGLRPRMGTVEGGPVAVIPPDRLDGGLVADLGVDENLLLHRALLRRFSRFGILDRRQVARRAAEAISKLDIRASGPTQRAGSLSGGNQQKVVVARALSLEPAVLVAAHATRGLDVDATAAVHAELYRFADAGGGILYISSDLDELADLCHRIFVMFRGRLAGPFVPPYDRRAFEAIGAAMAGA
jgi:simple sugar transport system ATP-binding protein